MRPNCPICARRPFFACDPPPFATVPGAMLAQRFTVRYCPHCDFYWNDSASGAADYERYYLAANKHHARNEQARRLDGAYFRRVQRRIVAARPVRSILDYGSGDLQFEALARERGIACSSFDVGAPSIGRKFDAIACLHAMEHFYSLDTAFGHFRAGLRPGGLLYIAVPDAAGYERTYYGAFNALDLEHINHFTTASLCALARTHGFDVLRSGRADRPVTATVDYPETWVLAQRSARRVAAPAATRAPARSSLATFSAYCERSAREFDALLGWYRARRSASRGRQLVLYGLGSPALRLLAALPEASLPDVLADGGKAFRGVDVAGRPVVEISARGTHWDANATVLVVAIHWRAIVEFLAAQGVPSKRIEVFEWGRAA